jgi:flavin reductase (DIM6/NTAB) family NADH-FMN oxidoreductase RutF
MEALENTAPQPVALICTPRPDGSTNLAPVAWWTYLESEPPMIGFSMAKESYTCELVSASGKVVICLPSEAIADEVLKCGSVSGRKLDKAVAYKIALTGNEMKYPIHSKLVFICDVSQRVIVGDCVFFVCDINEILLDEKQKHIYTLGKSEKLGAL